MLRAIFIIFTLICLNSFGQKWVLEDSIERNFNHLQPPSSEIPGYFAELVRVEGDYCFVSSWINHYDLSEQDMRTSYEYQIFKYDSLSSKWKFHQAILPFTGGNFQSVSINLSGNYLIISDYNATFKKNTKGINLIGAVAIFNVNENGFFEHFQTIYNPINNKSTGFGSDNLIINEQLLIGATYSPKNVFDQTDNSSLGAVLSYKLGSDSFEYDTFFLDPTPLDGEGFGAAIESYNELIIVSSPLEDYVTASDSIEIAGSFKLYNLIDGKLEFIETFKNPYPKAYNRFGWELNLGDQGLMVSKLNPDSQVYFYPWLDSLNLDHEAITFRPLSSINQRNKFAQNKYGFAYGVFNSVLPKDPPHARIGQVNFVMNVLKDWQNVQIIESQVTASTPIEKLNFRGFGRSVGLNDDYMMVACSPPFKSQIQVPSIIYVYKSYPCSNQTQSLELTVCDEYVSPSGQLHTQSAVFKDTSALPGGCILYSDIDLTVNHKSFTFIDTSLCGPFRSPSGVAYNYYDIEFYDTIPNAVGCDSIIHIKLDFESPKPDVLKFDDGTLYSIAQGSTFQWVDCLDDFKPLTGETNRRFTPWYEGVFAVIIDNTLCTIMSECIAVNKGDFNAEFPLDSILYFPNPNLGTVNINLGIPRESIDIQIYNSLGQLIGIERFKNKRLIDFELPKESGMYILHVKVDDLDVQVVRIIKI
ncbi:T9SS type A sorting domain-containing protein [bacterium]|nr:T9SS type A sorting domain-containing protein [bacterium]